MVQAALGSEVGIRRRGCGCRRASLLLSGEDLMRVAALQVQERQITWRRGVRVVRGRDTSGGPRVEIPEEQEWTEGEMRLTRHVTIANGLLAGSNTLKRRTKVRCSRASSS